MQGVPDAGPLLAVLPLTLEFLGESLARGAATVEQVLMDDPEGPECAIEVSYEGSCQLDEATLDDPDPTGREPGSAGAVGGVGSGQDGRSPLHLPNGREPAGLNGAIPAP